MWDRLGAANRYSKDEVLCQAGATLKIENFAGKVHHKFMVIDPDGSDPTVITGSANWSNAGFTKNDENLLIIRDGVVAQRYATEWKTLWDALPGHTICPASPLTIFLPLAIASD